MKSIILAGYFINWLVCPTNSTPTGDYRWVLDLQPGTQTKIVARTQENEFIECIWTTLKKHRNT